MTSFYTREELAQIGFAALGDSVQISRKASIYGAEQISIGSHVRIDDFCILSGKITIGNYVHISAGAYLFAGDAGIECMDYSGISSRGVIYAITDDYSGAYLANAAVPDACRHIISGKVTVGKYAILGTGCTVLPGVNIGEGCAVGAMSMVKQTTQPWGIYVGIPCRRIKERSKMCLTNLPIDRNISGGGYALIDFFAAWFASIKAGYTA